MSGSVVYSGIKLVCAVWGGVRSKLEQKQQCGYNLVDSSGKQQQQQQGPPHDPGTPGSRMPVISRAICRSQSAAAACLTRSGTPAPAQPIYLYDYDQVPAYLHGNHYITSGYRIKLTYAQCMKSLFYWSNETVNIWSHLAGFLYFCCLIFTDNHLLQIVPQQRHSIWEHVVITTSLLCYLMCMLCSALYHTLSCHSKFTHTLWLTMDLMGISVALLGIYLSSIYFAFACFPLWRDVYLVIFCALSCSVLWFQCHQEFVTSPAWWSTRIALYVALALYGLLPTLHWVLLNGGLHTHIVKTFVPKVFIAYCIGGLGVFFYISKYPERLFPGSVNYLGNSHNIFHVIMLAALVYWHSAGVEFATYILTQTHCLL